MSSFKKMIQGYFHRQSTKVWAQIEARDIYYLFPFNLESNDTKHDMVPNGSDPYDQVTIFNKDPLCYIPNESPYRAE